MGFNSGFKGLKHIYHKLHHISSCTVHLPILSKLIQCGLLSRNIVDIICIWYLFPFVIFLLPDTWFVMPHIALLSVFVFQISPRQPPNLSSSLISYLKSCLKCTAYALLRFPIFSSRISVVLVLYVRLGFVMSVRPSVRIEKLGPRWTDFHKICLSIFPESVEKIQVPLISDTNNDNSHEVRSKFLIILTYSMEQSPS